jgi:hypothetical protein
MRDDFARPVKRAAAARAGHRCSNPQCGAPTSGPSTEPGKSISVGVAAHITAASAGGPRFDPLASPGERRGIANAIWLCAKCARLVDTDPPRYPVHLLQQWKAGAERGAAEMLGHGPAPLSGSLRLQLPSLDSDDALLIYSNTRLETIGRDDELAELQAFLEDDRPFAWWAWTGGAGVGKSRLALELCRSVSTRWYAGFLAEDDQDALATFRPAGPTLVVIDYAGQRSEWLSRVLVALASGPPSSAVRLLVLERTASGPWWDELERVGRFVEGRLVASVRYGLPRELTGLEADDLRKLVEEVANELGKSVTGSALEDIVEYAYELDPGGAPLVAMLATMDSLTEAGRGPRDEVLKRLLARERARLTDSAHGLAAGESGLERARILATMVGGITPSDYVDMTNAAPNGLLPDIYQCHGPALDAALDGVEPDMLGELLVLEQLSPGTTVGVVANELAALAWSRLPNAYTAFVERAIADHPDHPNLAELVNVDRDASTGEWVTLAVRAVRSLERSDHPMIEWIVGQLDALADLGGVDTAEAVSSVRFRVANLVWREGGNAEANTLYTELLRTGSSSWPIYGEIGNMRGVTWYYLGRSDLAFADYTSVVELDAASDETRACALNNRADLLDEIDPYAAIADRTAVLELPNTTYNRRYIALIRRARAAWAVGDTRAAKVDIDTVLDAPDIAVEQKMAARLERAQWSRDSGKPAEALEDLRHVVSSRRNFEEVRAAALALLDDCTAPP